MIVLRLIIMFYLLTITSSFASEELTMDEVFSNFRKNYPNTKFSRFTKSPIKGLYSIVKDYKTLYTDGEYILIGNILTPSHKNYFNVKKYHSRKLSPIKSLNEIIYNDKIFYMDDMKNVVIGHIMTKSGKDLTYERFKEISSRKAVSNLDPNKALIIGDGDKHLIVEISDPECPVCRLAEKKFKGKDVTRLIYFRPLKMHKHARNQAVHVLCADDPVNEYKLMMEGRIPNQKLNYCKKGENWLNQMTEEIKPIPNEGTPIFWVDGEKVMGVSLKLTKLLE